MDDAEKIPFDGLVLQLQQEIVQHKEEKRRRDLVLASYFRCLLTIQVPDHIRVRQLEAKVKDLEKELAHVSVEKARLQMHVRGYSVPSLIFLDNCVA